MRATDLVFCTMLAFYSRDFSLSACLLKFFSLGISLCSDYANFTAKANAHCPEMHSFRQTNTHMHAHTAHYYIYRAPDGLLYVAALENKRHGNKSSWFSVFMVCLIWNYHTELIHTIWTFTQLAVTITFIRNNETSGCSNCTDAFLMRRLSFSRSRWAGSQNDEVYSRTPVILQDFTSQTVVSEWSEH